MPDRSWPLRWFSMVFLAAQLMLSPAGAETPVSGEKPPAESAPATQRDQAAEPEEENNNIEEKTIDLEKTMDATHERLERGILNQVIRLDNFFGKAKSEHQQKTKYELRWTNFLRIEHSGHVAFGTTARANIVLSRISERLRLIVSGGDEPEPVAPGLPEDPGNPGFDRASQTTRLVNTELRYGLLHTPSMDLFLGAGVRLILPPEAFVRGRYLYTYNISDVSLLKVGETLFVKNTVGPGQTTEFGLERSLNRKTLLRWASAGTISYEIKGVELGTELSLIRELSSKSAVTVTGGVYGNTSIESWVTNYRLLTRYRRNFLRSWLFYEIEPEMSWPRSADGYFPTNFAMIFRIEVLFKGAAVEKAEK